MTLDGVEFLRRFVQHVLPKGLVKIRHGGVLANRHRGERLQMCRRLLLVTQLCQQVAAAGVQAAPAVFATPPRVSCPRCGGQRVVVEELAAPELPRSAPLVDSS